MKKLLYVLLVTSVILVSVTYLLIPDEIIISETEQVESSERIVLKYLKDNDQIARWWPQEKSGTAEAGSALSYRNFRYSFSKPGFDSLAITIATENLTINSTLSWIPYSKNGIRLTWRASIPAGNNPIKRLLNYRQARKLKTDMTHIMERYLTFIVNRRKVYGYDFEIKTVTDTLLATTSFKSAAYPPNSRIYDEIHRLREFIRLRGIKATNPPMLNISLDAKGQYRTTLALPVAERFNSGNDILFQRMVAGNILVAEVRGGPGTVLNGFKQMELFMEDFNLSSPAINFESLVTDRSREPDTAKWVTRLYYPIY